MTLPIITAQQAEDLVQYIESNLEDLGDVDYCCASDAVDDIYAREAAILKLIRRASNEQA